MLFGGADTWVIDQTPLWQQGEHIAGYLTHQLHQHASTEVYDPLIAAHPTGGLICKASEAGGDVHRKSRDSFKPSCWTMVQSTCAKPGAHHSCSPVWLWDLPSPLPSCWPLELAQMDLQRLQPHHQAGGWGATCWMQTASPKWDTD